MIFRKTILIKMLHEIINGRRGNDIIVHGDVLYTCNSSLDKEKSYRYRNCIFKCSIIIENNNITSIFRHNHTAEGDKIMLLIAKNKIKNIALTTMDKPTSIIARELSKLTARTFCNMNKIKTLTDGITKCRNITGFTNLSMNCNIPPELRLDSRGNKFFRFDSGIQAENRLIIFASESKRFYIEKCDILFLDGILDLHLKVFLQTFMINGCIYGDSFPLMYSL